MRILVALILGIFGGFLIYFELAMLNMPKLEMILQSNESREMYLNLFVIATFFGGWAATSYLMLVGTKTITKVISRGFLIGATLWLLFIPVGILFAGSTLNALGSQSNGEIVGATMGVVSLLTGGVAIVMVLVCLIGYAVTYSLSREMKPDVIDDRIECPSCAELIKKKAKICRFCGYEFSDNIEIASQS